MLMVTRNRSALVSWSLRHQPRRMQMASVRTTSAERRVPERLQRAGERKLPDPNHPPWCWLRVKQRP